ncbi:hypothetical protein [Lentzea guizhouensis]|nr:hypothetical protein [Lentzea guizhouensis]
MDRQVVLTLSLLALLSSGVVNVLLAVTESVLGRWCQVSAGPRWQPR